VKATHCLRRRMCGALTILRRFILLSG
jgi:hypothetical protein